MRNTDSYTVSLKKSLARVNISDNKCSGCLKYEAYAYLLSGIQRFEYEDKDILKHIAYVLYKCNVYYSVCCRYNKAFNDKSYYICINGTDMHQVSRVPCDICCACSYVRACFIASGYISKPGKPLHFEISFKNEEAFDLCKQCVNMLKLDAKYSYHNGRYIIYMKKRDSISTMLARIGAVKEMLEIESDAIVKEVRNNTNRAINCDSGNISKTVDSYIKTKEMIERHIGTAAFDNLPDGLKSLAMLRLENPDLSLTELGMLMTPPLSKAGVAHRFHRMELLLNDNKNVLKKI